MPAEDAVEMALRADHRPQVPKRLDIVELGEAGLGDHVQSLAGRIGKEVQVKLLQGVCPCGKIWGNR